MKIIIFDDDPTGSQTVYGCPLLLKWDNTTLIEGFRNKSPLLFLLANTRSMTPRLAMKRTIEICKSINDVITNQNISFRDCIFISRGDSTLRGHGTLEPLVINRELGPFDATFHVPSFFEGGRTTVDGVHLLNGSPVHTTPFARDPCFAYSTSHLDLWLEEKSGGSISAKDVKHLRISFLEEAIESKSGMNRLIQWLRKLSDNDSVVVDAESPSHLLVFSKAIRRLLPEKRFLFRSSASFINCLADLPTPSINRHEFSGLRRKSPYGFFKPGLVMVGSYVPLADEQLKVLVRESSCFAVELPLRQIACILSEDLTTQKILDLKKEILTKLNLALETKKTPILYTSRGNIDFESLQERILFGNTIAEIMADIVAQLSPHLGYVISKGGITTHIFLEKGLKVDTVQLKGQLFPGLSLVLADNNLTNGPLPVITFPGNLGDQNSLLNAWKLMESLTC